MCLGARKLHPRLDSRVGKQGSRGSEKGAMLSLRNALSYGVRVRPLSSGTPTRVGTRIHRRKMQWDVGNLAHNMFVTRQKQRRKTIRQVAETCSDQQDTQDAGEKTRFK